MLFVDKIGHSSLTAYSYTAPCTCIVVMVILDQPLFYSAYPWIHHKFSNDYIAVIL